MSGQRQVIRMDKRFEQTLLYDFYGELLTEHQKKIYEAVIFDDLSYAEAADMFSVSRQAVHDNVRRTELLLRSYEEKLGLVDRFVKTKELVKEINLLAREFEKTGDAESVRKIAALSEEIGEL